MSSNEQAASRPARKWSPRKLLRIILVACSGFVYWYGQTVASAIWNLKDLTKLAETDTLSEVLLPGALAYRHIPLWVDILVTLLTVTLTAACVWAVGSAGRNIYQEVREAVHGSSGIPTVQPKPRPTGVLGDAVALLWLAVVLLVLAFTHPRFGDWSAMYLALLTAISVLLALCIGTLAIAVTAFGAVDWVRKLNTWRDRRSAASSGVVSQFDRQPLLQAGDDTQDNTQREGTEATVESDRPDKNSRPTVDGDTSWNAYWTAQGMPWRTEPEIDEERQAYLTERRAIKPDLELGIYPFRDVHRPVALTRADVEWLLAAHESGGMRGPVDWSDEKQRQRAGLDLRGADLRGADLGSLPLSGVRAGLSAAEWLRSTDEQRMAAPAHLEGARLERAHLEGSILGGTNLGGIDAYHAYLLAAHLRNARLQRANLRLVHLEGANLRHADLSGANLTLVFFDEATNLRDINLGDVRLGFASLADIRWRGVNLAVVDWYRVRMLGDERYARMRHEPNGSVKDRATRSVEYEVAVRANRQLATALRGQGLNEYADHFAYRAQVLQREVFWRQRASGRAFFSGLLDLVAGYGYKPMRSVATYLLVVLSFAAAYFALTNFAITPFLPSHSSPLAWYEALVLSVSSFHGRGLFPTGLSLGDPVAILAAFEAIIGLLIEITFIATFTQRFFAR